MSSICGAVMILGSSQFENQAFKALKHMGLKLVMTDINPMCKQRDYADEFFVADAADKHQILKCFEASIYRHSILMAYCGNDFGIMAAAAINSLILGQNVFDFENVDANNKVGMKLAFERAEVPVPSSVSFESGLQVSRALASIDGLLDFPVVVKPADSSGARGVSVCRDLISFETGLSRAKIESDLILVEEYIDGCHLDLNGYVVGGEFFRSGSSDRLFLPEPSRVMLKNYAPSILNDSVLERAWVSLEHAAKAQGIKFGPIKADFIVREDIPILLETSLRFHGGLTSCGSMMVSGTSFSLPQMVCTMDRKFTDQLFDYWKPLGDFGSVHLLPGARTRGVSFGLKVPATLPGIAAFYERNLGNRKGRGVKDLLDNRDISGYLVAAGVTREECDFNVARALLEIGLEQGLQ